MKEERAEKKIGDGVGFDRIRRITGYLVGTVERFNNGKKAEERDSVNDTSFGIFKYKKYANKTCC